MSLPRDPRCYLWDALKAAEAAGVSQRIDVQQLDVTEFDRIPSFLEDVVRKHGASTCWSITPFSP